MAKEQTAAVNMEEFDWVQFKKEIGGQHAETTKEKLQRKIKQNPLVPIGCLATAGALSYGLWSFRQGRPKMSQYMMRARIAAQGFTVVALMVGVAMTYAKTNEKND